MIKNYLKIAWRNLRKNRLYSLINIGGLAIGMAVSFMLLIYVYNEFTFDKFNANSDRLYRVMRNQPSKGDLITGSPTPTQLGAVVEKDLPEIEKFARTNGGGDNLVNYQGKSLKINTIGADPALLDMFSFDFVSGDKKTALADQSSIVLTESAVKSIFGDRDPIGQTLKLNNKFLLKVSAVIKDNPANSSFRFKALISWKQLEVQQNWIKTSGWGNYSFTTYALLKPATNLTAVNAKLKDIIGRYDPMNKENKIFLFPFAKAHLYGEFKNGVNTGGAIETVRLFLLLAICILLIACINFMNLSTAQSEKRAREVGVRKAIGAHRFSLILQFMSESLLMAFVAFVFALVLIASLINVFDNLINIRLIVPYTNVWAWLAAIGVTLVTGLVAGSYPALFLSSFKAIKVLKGQVVNARAVFTPRKVLVVLQFSFAIGLILFSIFIYKQINYTKDRPVGYEKVGLIEMPYEGALYKHFETFRQDAINAGAITDGALTSMSIANNYSSSWGITWQGQLPGEDKIPIDQMATTYHVVNTYGLKLVEGRDFSTAYPSDTAAIILNQAAVAMMRFKHPLGQIVKYQNKNCSVVGVVENFVWGSPYEPVKPAIIGFIEDWSGNIALRLNPDQSISKSLATLGALYKKYNPDYPFQYKFTDEAFAEKFNQEKLLGTMATGFTCLAIVISCLGLFGLASFSAEQRKKEIGIRKVLGATTGNLWINLSVEFVWLVLISFVIGSAISFYYVNQWLGKFTYHTSISVWVFLATMVLSLTICLLTVSWQAVKAALSNPVTSLRSE
ncbi:MAG: ABC transporter permease [Sphingobacteriales bacterium]